MFDHILFGNRQKARHGVIPKGPGALWGANYGAHTLDGPGTLVGRNVSWGYLLRLLVCTRCIILTVAVLSAVVVHSLVTEATYGLAATSRHVLHTVPHPRKSCGEWKGL